MWNQSFSFQITPFVHRFKTFCEQLLQRSISIRITLSIWRNGEVMHWRVTRRTANMNHCVLGRWWWDFDKNTSVTLRLFVRDECLHLVQWQRAKSQGRRVMLWGRKTLWTTMRQPTLGQPASQLVSKWKTIGVDGFLTTRVFCTVQRIEILNS